MRRRARRPPGCRRLRFGLLHTAASRVGGADARFRDGRRGRGDPREGWRAEALFLLGADETDLSAFADTFTVYIGTHGDAGVRRGRRDPARRLLCREAGDVGEPRGPRAARRPRGIPARRCARGLDDLARALRSARAGRCRSTRSTALRAAIAAAHPHLAEEGLADGRGGRRYAGAAPSVSGAIVYPITDFYLTNPIARASETMQRCSAELLHGQDFAEAAE